MKITSLNQIRSLKKGDILKYENKKYDDFEIVIIGDPKKVNLDENAQYAVIKDCFWISGKGIGWPVGKRINFFSVPLSRSANSEFYILNR